MGALERVIILIPSLGKDCGIAEYSRHVAQGLRHDGHVVEIASSIAATCQLLDRDPDQVVIIQHDFGLFDRLEPNRCGPDSTHDVCAFVSRRRDQGFEAPWIVMHTFDLGNPQRQLVTEMFLASGARVFSTHPSVPLGLGVERLELGVTKPALLWSGGNADATSTKELTCMTFGFVNPAKGISAVLAAASIHGFAVNAQWPTSSAWERRLISRAWDHAGVRGKLEFGFLDEDRLMESMSMCDFVFLPQGSLPYYSVSGSVRLALSMGMPVLTSAARQFEGLEVCTYVVAEGALDPAMTWISIPDNRRDLSTHALTYARANSIPSVYRRALMTQVGSPVPDPRKALTEIRLSSPPAREARLTFVPLGAKVWAHRLLDRWQVCAAALGLWPLDRALRRAGG